MPFELGAVVTIAALAAALGIRGRRPWGHRMAMCALLVSSVIYYGESGSLVRRLAAEGDSQSYAKGVIDMSNGFAPLALALLCNIAVLAGLTAVWSRASSRDACAVSKRARST
jgi:hypothetical protein